ncbi:MAG: hypothetical protein M0R38_12945 [Bacteroidia bacterium]|nr:hypothetical protein [Bacteroidia bacterium]
MNILGILGAVIGLLLGLVSLQGKKISKQKADIRKKEQELVSKTALTKASEDIREQDKKLTDKEVVKADKIKGAKDEKELTDVINTAIDDFNKL